MNGLFDKKLIYEMCETYGIEIEEGEGNSQICDNGVLRDLTEQDIQDMFGIEKCK